MFIVAVLEFVQIIEKETKNIIIEKIEQIEMYSSTGKLTRLNRIDKNEARTSKSNEDEFKFIEIKIIITENKMR